MVDQQKDLKFQLYRPNKKTFPFSAVPDALHNTTGRNQKRFLSGLLQLEETSKVKPVKMVIKDLTKAPQISFTFLKNHNPQLFQEIAKSTPYGKLSIAESTYVAWITLIKMGFDRSALIPSLRLIKNSPNQIAMTDLTVDDGWVIDNTSSSNEIQKRLGQPAIYERVKKQAYYYAKKASDVDIALPWDGAFVIHGSNKLAPHAMILDMEEMRIGIDDPSKISGINSALVTTLFSYLDRALLIRHQDVH